MLPSGVSGACGCSSGASSATRAFTEAADQASQGSSPLPGVATAVGVAMQPRMQQGGMPARSKKSRGRRKNDEGADAAKFLVSDEGSQSQRTKRLPPSPPESPQARSRMDVRRTPTKPPQSRSSSSSLLGSVLSGLPARVTPSSPPRSASSKDSELAAMQPELPFEVTPSTPTRHDSLSDDGEYKTDSSGDEREDVAYVPVSAQPQMLRLRSRKQVGATSKICTPPDDLFVELAWREGDLSDKVQLRGVPCWGGQSAVYRQRWPVL